MAADSECERNGGVDNRVDRRRNVGRKDLRAAQFLVAPMGGQPDLSQRAFLGQDNLRVEHLYKENMRDRFVAAKSTVAPTSLHPTRAFNAYLRQSFHATYLKEGTEAILDLQHALGCESTRPRGSQMMMVLLVSARSNGICVRPSKIWRARVRRVCPSCVGARFSLQHRMTRGNEELLLHPPSGLVKSKVVRWRRRSL